MQLKVTVPDNLMIDSRQAAEAARMGVSELVREHLRGKNAATKPLHNFTFYTFNFTFACT